MKLFLWFRHWGIRIKLIILVISTIILTVSTVTILNYINVSHTLVENTGEKLSSVSEKVSELIIRQIHSEIDLFAFLATTDSINEAVTAANTEIRTIPYSEQMQSILFLDEDWIKNRPAAKEKIQRLLSMPISQYLRGIQNIYREELELFLTNESGEVIGMTSPTSDYYQADEDWWIHAKEQGLYIGNPAYDESVGRWAIILAVSILDPNTQQFAGVLRGSVDITVVFDSILSMQVGEEGSGLFIGENRMVYELNGETVTQSVLPTAYQTLIQSSGTRWVESIPNLQGTPSLMAIHPISDGVNHFGWVAAIIPQAEISREMQTTLQQTVTLAVIFILLFGLLAILFANNITGGLRLLENEAKEMSVGNYTHEFSRKIYASQEADIRNLVQTFDQMKQEISDREMELQEREEKHRLLVDTMNEGLVMMDAESKIQYLNPTVAHWTGYAQETLIQKEYNKLFPLSEQTLITSQIILSKRGKQTPFESVIQTRDHGLLPVLVSPQSMMDNTGTYLGCLVVMTDISASKKTELALKKRIDQLASLQQIDQSILDGTSIQNVVETVFYQLRNQLGVYSAGIYLYDPHSKQVILASYFIAENYGTIDPTSILIDRLEADYEQNKTGFLRMITAQQIIAPEIFRPEDNFMYSLPVRGVLNLKGVIQIGFEYQKQLDEEWNSYFDTLMSQAALGFDKIQLMDNLQVRNSELEEAYNSAIKGWASALELRDKETKGHSDRVVRLAEEIARKMGFSGTELVKIRTGSLLHDIGKMGVPDHILLKPGPLDHEEWEIMKKHPEFAYQLLCQIPFLKESTDIPRYHHEHWDGNGYPHHLQGDEIPLSARIFAIVDVWDALTSDRPYRKAWTVDQTLEYLKQNRGKQFDPQVTDVFLDCLAQDKNY